MTCEQADPIETTAIEEGLKERVGDGRRSGECKQSNGFGQ
jgi:hypothetical protein